jgi:hypothetical protein
VRTTCLRTLWSRYKNITSDSGLWVWHYMGNIGFPLSPYPYYADLAEDIGALAAEGVSGYFGQSASAGIHY